MLVFTQASFAANAGAPIGAGTAVDKILGGKISDVTQSVHVVRISDGATLYEKNPDQTLVPASVTKVLTSATALSRFTPVHTFKTKFFASGRQGKTVTGNLYVQGDGDPFLVSEKLWQVAADLRHLGIQEIRGDIIIDNSLFDGPARDDSRKSGKNNSHNAYDAPVSAFGVNFNTYAVAVAPGEKAGAPAFVSLDPYPLSNVQIVNQVKTTGSGGKDISVNRTSGKNGDRITVSGTIAVGEPVAKVYRSVGNNVVASGMLLRSFFEAAGIAVKGSVGEGRIPGSAQEILVLDSYEMSKIVSGLNVFSNNYIADVLIKRLGAAFPKTGKADAPGSGSYENGVDVIRRFLREDVGIKSAYTLNDGSGLSVDNRLSARQITQVLAYMETRMDVFPEFFFSLPATGWNGTLKKRFGKGDAMDLRGLIRAKTGTLTQPVSVAGLAGYFRHPQHGLVAFSIIENGNSGKKQPAIAALRDRQDEVVVSLMTEI
jgi:D-alanyl-D-alanine carboxypeptidase/D-alanyl-D-alanine-endopeptidase (penicillin-binding protein 4)